MSPLRKGLLVALILVVILIIVAATGGSSNKSSRSGSPPPPPPSDQVVMSFDIGYDATPNMPWKDLTQVVLFALETTTGPGLDTHLIRVNPSTWVAAAHGHGVKAFISIGGSDDQNWQNACNDANRTQFVQNLVDYATSRGFDGIDLDMENRAWSKQGRPSAAMTTCIEAISSAAHSAGLLVSADVITNWQGPWFAPSQSHVDQFNLMTYGDDLTRMKADVAATVDQGLPAAKFVVGIDVLDGPDPQPGSCAQFSSYAASAGLMGAFLWEAKADAGNVCAHGLVGH
jgi:hypothetical protein